MQGDRIMRVCATAAGAIMAALLGGCSVGSGLPDIPMLTGSSADGGSPPAATAAVSTAEQPPVPERNPKKKKQAAPARTATATAANQAPPAAAKASESDSGFSLASLTQLNIFGGDGISAPESVHSGASPIATYTYIAQQVHSCWLTPGAPKLPNHGFHADVSPKDANTAKIILYEKGPDKKRGTQVFKIVIGGSGGGSVITSDNYRLDARLDAAFKADLARWAKGDSNCRG